MGTNEMIRKFADAFANVAAHSDYSRHTKLQAVSRKDIEAAAEALWIYVNSKGQDPWKLDLTEADVITAMLAQTGHYGDESELVSTEYPEYWDATDEMRFSSFLVNQMAEELSARFLAAKRAKGYTTVSNADGIWLFKFGE